MAETHSERDAALALDMLSAARDALAFLEGLDETDFLASRLHQNAVIRSLEVVGEAAGKISTGTRAAHPDIGWRQITGMRHRLIHGYADIRLDLVWDIAQTDFPHSLPLCSASYPPRRAQEIPARGLIGYVGFVSMEWTRKVRQRKE